MRSIPARIIVGLVVLCGTLALHAQTRSRRVPAAPTPGAPGQDQTRSSEPTRIQVEFFQVVCPAKDLSKISVDELGEGKGSAEELIKKLSAFGEASLQVRISNVIDLSRTSTLNEGSRVPIVSGTNVSPNGKITPSITYNDVGAIVRIQGTWDEERRPDTAHVNCSISLASLGRTTTDMGDGVHLPEFRQFKVEQEMDLETDTPILLMSTSQAVPPSGVADAVQNKAPSQCTVTLMRITARKLATTKPGSDK